MRPGGSLLTLVAVVCVALISLAPAASAAPRPGSSAHDGTQVLRLLNAQRAAHKLPALKLAAGLTRAARGHSRDMLARHYFAHDTLNGPSFDRRIRRDYRGGRILGENIGWGSGRLGSPAAMVRAWMHSPGHRANILRRPFRRIGIGIATGTFLGYRGAVVYTTDFAG